MRCEWILFPLALITTEPISSLSNHSSQTKVLGDKWKEAREPEDSWGKEGGGACGEQVWDEASYTKEKKESMHGFQISQPSTWKKLQDLKKGGLLFFSDNLWFVMLPFHTWFWLREEGQRYYEGRGWKDLMFAKEPRVYRRVTAAHGWTLL